MRWALLSGCAALGAASDRPALAQALLTAPPPPTAGQVTPRSIAPENKQPTAVPTIDLAPMRVPDGADALFFTPLHIVVEGSFGAPDPAAAIVRAIEGRRISVADFYAAASAIERAFAQAGYPLVRVVVPAQRLLDGAEAHLVVVDGFVESIGLDGVAPSLRRPMRRYLGPLIGKRHLHYAELERRLTLAGDVPGTTIRSTLAHGTKPGGVRLVIEARRKLMSASLSFDNRQSASFRRRSTTLQASLNSPLGIGEQAYAYLSADPWHGTGILNARSPRTSFGGGLYLPLGSDGLKLNVEATRSITRPIGGLFATRDVFMRYAWRLSYPVVRTRAETLTVTAGFELSNEANAAPDFGVDLSRDHFRIARLSGDYSTRVPLGLLTLGATLTSGFGDRPTPDAPPSRAGTTPHFTKLEGDASLSRWFPLGVMAVATARGQVLLHGGPPSGELFSLDGTDALAAFTSGALSAEEGYTGRFELRRPIDLRSAIDVTPFCYVAAGHAHYRVRNFYDPSFASAWGGGVEVDLHPHGSALSAYTTVEYGRQHTNGVFFVRDDRISVAAGARF